LQQIEHGVLTILGGYESMGRVYRGIIVPTLEQYTMVGDPSNQTDNLNYNKAVKYSGKYETRTGINDDRQVYTEEHPGHEYAAIIGLAAAARTLKDYDQKLADRCLKAATGLWKQERTLGPWDLSQKINAASELLITTNDDEYRNFLTGMADSIAKRISRVGWYVVRTIPVIKDENYKTTLEKALAGYAKEIEKQGGETPYGVPYRPRIWGAGWDIQEFGMRQYYLSKHYPDLFSIDYMYNALNFVLGCHPGTNGASFASGVGSKSAVSAYSFYRIYNTYIPGGVVSGTALIRPDFAELKEFPYLWQQTEYVLGGGESNYLFLVLAADKLLNQQ
jgi:endoglucanase